MPMGQGYSVEAQLTGKEVVGGLQFEITPTIPQESPPPPPLPALIPQETILPTPPSGFSIKIHQMTGRIFYFACSPSDTIGSIKKGIEDQQGINADTQKLFYAPTSTTLENG
ncbi:uncharacterized protein F4807DRAFT_171973 [Annulohypoxylon truncatum]|uniref:uncharacterized protein n=1 Tax=Annulohypoxylon truncatum TaxID=327061 RepID=UPI0020089625|nr:uncharacterized protein F4807DRAFT_171973 [Annulohypoxylon truncatum]KAI1207587.1 hypothetical protein F4807DRAFT_171973 [Annulohypoxylon truncatum]